MIYTLKRQTYHIITLTNEEAHLLKDYFQNPIPETPDETKTLLNTIFNKLQLDKEDRLMEPESREK